MLSLTFLFFPLYFLFGLDFSPIHFFSLFLFLSLYFTHGKATGDIFISLFISLNLPFFPMFCATAFSFLPSIFFLFFLFFHFIFLGVNQQMSLFPAVYSILTFFPPVISKCYGLEFSSSYFFSSFYFFPLHFPQGKLLGTFFISFYLLSLTFLFFSLIFCAPAFMSLPPTILVFLFYFLTFPHDKHPLRLIISISHFPFYSFIFMFFSVFKFTLLFL